ncbi:MAG: HPF/RaiA family ribosome-associated protein [Bacteroidia bacterium]|nr:HPF/RaiA family ribosome-associated protein [Bacteroidia bacterium]
MKIQLNTDKTVKGGERHQEYFTSEISEKLKIYESHITRIEVHFADENGAKEGINDVLCTLEARIEGRQPIAVSNKADNMELALSGALHKLKSALEKIMGRIKKHESW